MKTLTNAIQNNFDVPRVTKYEVIDVTDDDTATPPSMSISVRLYGPGNVPYGIDVRLLAFDSSPSVCLEINPLQQGYTDLFRPVGRIVTGAYTTLSTAYNSNITNPTKRKRCLAVEALLPTTLLDSAFAVT